MISFSLFLVRFVDTLQVLYWAMFGLTGTDTLELSSRNYLAEQVGTFLFATYLVVAAIILLNALIGMLSSTYNIVEVWTSDDQ